MKKNIKIILYLILILTSNNLASRIIGGPFENLTIWRHWVVKNGSATEKISFYNSDSIDVKLSAKLVVLKDDYRKNDSTVAILWDSILVKNKALETHDFPSINLEDLSRVYLSITKETQKDTTVQEYPLENYFPIGEISENGNYIPFGWANSIHLIFKVGSLIYESNKDYLIDLYIKCTPKNEVDYSVKKIHLITHEQAQKFLFSNEMYSKFLEKTPIVLELDESNKANLLLGLSDFGNTIDLIDNRFENYSKVRFRIDLPEMNEPKVIGAPFFIQRGEGSMSFHQLNFLVR